MSRIRERSSGNPAAPSAWARGVRWLLRLVPARWRESARSEYARGLGAVLSGSVIAQAVPILFAPLVTRLYAPAAYGSLAIYMSVVAIGAVVASSQYVAAIMLPRRESEAVNLLALSLTAAAGIGLLTLPLVILARPLLFATGEFETLSRWILVVPFSVFVAGAGASLGFWAARQQDYALISVSRVAQAVTAVGVQIGVGLFHPTASSLLAAYVIGSTVGAAVLGSRLVTVDRKWRRVLSLRATQRFARERIRFVLYVLPADLINTLTNQLPVLTLSRFVGSAAVGHYGLTQRVLGLPMGLLGSSVVEVFRQRATSEYNSSGSCRATFATTFRMLAAIGLVPVLLLLFFGPELFSAVFGAGWSSAGLYAQILSPFMYLRLIASPLSYVYLIANRQREDLVMHLWMALSTIPAMYAGYVFFGGGPGMVAAFSANYSLIYLVYLVRSYRFACGDAHLSPVHATAIIGRGV